MPRSNKEYLKIMRHYDACLQQHGDTARGADWPNETGRQTRFSVMLDLLEGETDDRVDLLDFACGTGELLRHLHRLGRPSIAYHGADISRSALEFARAKFPDTKFTTLDILCRETWPARIRSEEHTSELQSQSNLVFRLLLEKKKQHINA